MGVALHEYLFLLFMGYRIMLGDFLSMLVVSTISFFLSVPFVYGSLFLYRYLEKKHGISGPWVLAPLAFLCWLIFWSIAIFGYEVFPVPFE